jgi:syntaxin 1A
MEKILHAFRMLIIYGDIVVIFFAKMPPPRDRMAAMQQQAYFGEEDDYNIPIDDEHPEGMQDFFHEIEQMRETPHQVKLEIDKTKQLQNEILSAPSVDAKSKQGLEDTMNVIKKKANTIRTGLKKMEVAIEQEEQNNPSAGAQLRMKKTQHMAISKTFIEMMTEYNKIQTDFREQSKKKIGRQMELAGSNLTEDQLEDMLDKGEGAQLVGHVHIEGDADQLRQTINDIENRHEMFISLEKSITELHDMFIDIATLIESQGEMVNRIDTHVDSAVEYTTRATNDTKKALEYQSKARRKKIMMMLCMIVAGSLGSYIGLKYLGFV